MSDNITVPAVERALDVLEYLASAVAEKSLKEIGSELDIPAASLFRIIKNLTARGYLLQVSENPPKYVLGYKISQLAEEYSNNHGIVNVIMPYMRQLSQRTDQTAQFAIRTGKNFIYIAQALSAAPVNFIAHLYTPMEINTSAGAKCILAQMPVEAQKEFLENIELKKGTEKTIIDKDKLLEELRITRQRGYGLDDEEFKLGIGCVAAPVLSTDGSCIGAIGVTGSIDDYKDEEKFEKLKEEILEISKVLSKKIG